MNLHKNAPDKTFHRPPLGEGTRRRGGRRRGSIDVGSLRIFSLFTVN